MKEYKGLKIPTVGDGGIETLKSEQAFKCRELSNEEVFPPHCDDVTCEECLYDANNFETYKQYSKEPASEYCEHGKGLNDYCEPCGRVNGG